MKKIKEIWSKYIKWLDPFFYNNSGKSMGRLGFLMLIRSGILFGLAGVILEVMHYDPSMCHIFMMECFGIATTLKLVQKNMENQDKNDEKTTEN